MTKVLSANFMRLKKDRVFWIGVVFMFAAAPFLPCVPLCSEFFHHACRHQAGFAVGKIDNPFFGVCFFDVIFIHKK